MTKMSTVPTDKKLIFEAESFGLDAARVTEIHQRSVIEKKRREIAWRRQNRRAIQAWNAWLEENGLPLEDLRPW